MEPVEKVIHDAKMDKGKIYDIVLVGGWLHLYSKGPEVASRLF
jgi:molecular chaperone DnaK (HSP70)